MSAAPAQRSSPIAFWPALGAIVAACVLVRVVHTLAEAPWPPPGLDDQFFFSALPKLLADGHGFVNPFKEVFDHVTVPTAEHPPFYSVVLAAVAKLGGTSPDVQRLTGTVFGAGSVLLIGILGRRLAGDLAGLCAAALAAVYPILIAADGALMSESLYGVLVVGTVLLAYLTMDSPAVGRALALGALGALAALTRGEALVLLPLLLLPLLRSAQGRRAAALAAVAFVVVLAPWTARNWIVFDQPVVIANNSGSAVAGANCDATFYDSDFLGGWQPDCIVEHPGNEAEDLSESRRDGFRYAGDHLGRLPVVLAVRFGRVWSLYDPFQVPEGRSPRVQKLGVICFFLLVPLGIYGLVLLRRRRVPVWPLVAPFVVVSISALTTYGNVRFRQPADLTLVVLAGVGLAALVGRRRPGAAPARPAVPA
ncbi:MAG: glycosyltransferase family 39 protein [Thermoleophilaceae bacterium]|nr:glycosyltransferase family 39 protein [Thermoleophilaceae bacterium]